MADFGPVERTVLSRRTHRRIQPHPPERGGLIPAKTENAEDFEGATPEKLAKVLLRPVGRNEKKPEDSPDQAEALDEG